MKRKISKILGKHWIVLEPLVYVMPKADPKQTAKVPTGWKEAWELQKRKLLAREFLAGKDVFLVVSP